MAISFPLAFPPSGAGGMASIAFRRSAVVGVSESPFTKSQQVFVHPGQAWGASVRVIRLTRADAEEWIGRLVALNGMEGTFLMGDPAGGSPRGTWTTPLVDGSHAAGVSTVAMKGMGGAGVTGKIGDWLQLGTGANAHLHKVVEDFTADGSGLADVEIWPATRAALSDNDDVTIETARGLWRLSSNEQGWSIDEAIRYGIDFDCVEAL